MSFSNIAVGNPFYILRRSEKPTLEIGVVKSKVDKPSTNYNYPNQNPLPIMINPAMPPKDSKVVVVVDINGREVTVPEVPGDIEIASDKDGNMYSDSREAMLQAVEVMIQTSKKALEQIDYHKVVLTEGDLMLEALNPKYKEDKQQAKIIKQLEEKQAATDKKLDEILQAIKLIKPI